MKNKKGFVFIETLIVTAVLTASLLMLYSSYSALIRNEKTRIKYNDSAFLYRTYYLEKFFRNFYLGRVTNGLNKTNSLLTGFNCESLFNIEYNNSEDTEKVKMEKADKGLCETLIVDLHVNNLYLTYNDLSALQDCKDYTGACSALGQVSFAASNYIKTIGGKGKQGYRIIIEFAEPKDDISDCNEDEKNCEFYYATLSLGDIE